MISSAMPLRSFDVILHTKDVVLHLPIKPNLGTACCTCLFRALCMWVLHFQASLKVLRHDSVSSAWFHLLLFSGQ
jgi:hypothetical protein